MQTQMENHQENNKPTSPQLTPTEIVADGNEQERVSSISLNVNSVIVNTNENESKSPCETEDHQYENLDDIMADLPQPTNRMNRSKNRKKSDDRFSPLW